MSDEDDDDWDAAPSRAGLGGGVPSPPAPATRQPARRSPPGPAPSRNHSAAAYLRSALQANPRRPSKRGRPPEAPRGASDDDPGARRAALGGYGGDEDAESGGDDGADSDGWDVDGDDAFALPEAFGGGARTRRKRRRGGGAEAEAEEDVDVDVDVELGGWERHTKGVGSKLLQKMGFTGRLGLREDGIAQPLSARVRPEKAGIGAGGFVERTEEEAQMDTVLERNQKTGVVDEPEEGGRAGGKEGGSAARGGKRWQKHGARERKTRKGKSLYGTRLKLVDLTGGSGNGKMEEGAVGGDGVARGLESLDLECVEEEGSKSVAELLLVQDDDDAPAGGGQGPFDVPELVFNLRMLCDQAEGDVQVAARKRATEELLRANAASERERVAKSLVTAKEDLQHISLLKKHVSDFLVEAKTAEKAAKAIKKQAKAAQRRKAGDEDCVDVGSGGGTETGLPDSSKAEDRLESPFAAFVRALETFSSSGCVGQELHKRTHDPCGIREMVVAITEARAGPLVTDLLSTVSRIPNERGSVMGDASCGSSLGTVSELCGLLNATQPILGSRDISESYMRLACRVVINPLRRAVGVRWNAREPDALVNFVDKVLPVLPLSLVSAFMEEILVPRLSREVETWTWTNPKDAAAPLHLWLFPWLPVSGKRNMAPVLSLVRQKISAVIRGWAVRQSTSQSASSRYEATRSVVSLVAPWVEVLSQKKVQGALSRHVSPILISSLASEMSDQGLSKYGVSLAVDGVPTCRMLDEVLLWVGVMDNLALATSILHGLFPGLLKALHMFLFQSDDSAAANLPKRSASAASWYEVWRDRMPTGIRSHVRPGLASLLFVIHSSSKHADDASFRKKLAASDPSLLLRNRYAPISEPKPESSSERKARMRPGKREQGRRATLREVVRSVAIQEGLPFHDSGRMTKDGRHLYVFGETIVLLDGARQVVLADSRSGTAGVEGRLVAVDMETLARLGRGGNL